MSRPKRTSKELTEPDQLAQTDHAFRLFEIAKHIRFAVDPAKTLQCLADAAMWLAAGSVSNVPLGRREKAELDDLLDVTERLAFRHLPAHFTRPEILAGFDVMRRQAERWAEDPLDRDAGDARQNLVDLGRIWQNDLHNALLRVDVARRSSAESRRSATIAAMMHEPAFGLIVGRPN